MSTVDSIFGIVIFHICMWLFESTFLSSLQKLIGIKIQVLPTDTVAQLVEHRCAKPRTWVQILASVIFFIFPLRSFFLCYHGEKLEGPISTGV